VLLTVAGSEDKQQRVNSCQLVWEVRDKDTPVVILCAIMSCYLTVFYVIMLHLCLINVS